MTPQTTRAVPVTRRNLLKAGAAASALLLVRPSGALATPIGPSDAYGTSRASRLFPGTWVVHTDMHNHTLFSDGAGDAAEAFGSMRDAGLDVASLTDHSTIGQVIPGPFADGNLPCMGQHDCQGVAGLDEVSWQRTAELADGADVPGEFTAIRGFEWSSPTLGHMNVWFSERWSDPLSTGGLGSVEDLLAFAEEEGLSFAGGALGPLRELIEQTPAAGVGMAGWYEWCKREASTPVIGGGADGLLGFNHPGREPFRFSDFAFDADLLDRVVSMEILNRREDYLFEVVRGRSPLVACLDAGWQPGLLGVTDEHGTDWGFPDGKGRGGFWVDGLSRDAVRDAMLDRRFFATVLQGLRLDAAANGVRMGQPLGHRSGPVSITLDIDRGPGWVGKDLVAQVLTTGAPMPRILESVPFRVPAPDDPLPTITLDLDAGDVPWLVLRITDPEVAAPSAAPEEYRGDGAAVAYASPWFVDPSLPAPGPGGGDGGEPGGPPDGRPGQGPPDGRPPGTPPRGPRSDTPAGAVVAAVVPDRGPLPVTGGGRSGAGALLLGAAAGLLALRRRQTHDHQH